MENYKDGYVVRKTTVGGKKGCTVRLHRVVIGAKAGELVDHIDRDKRNNARSNLRIASKSENGRNQSKRKGLSQFKGVTWNKKSRKWQAQIRVSPSHYRYLGLYSDEHVAAHEYNKAAILHYGEFACLNPVGIGG